MEMNITKIDRKTDRKRLTKRELNLVTALREWMIIIAHEVHLHLYALTNCHRRHRSTCVCWRYHRLVLVTFPIYCKS